MQDSLFSSVKLLLLKLLIGIVSSAFLFSTAKAVRMEGRKRRVRLERVSFPAHASLPFPMNERLEKIDERKALDLCSKESQLSACHCPLEIPKSPHQAMEYLSRTWSPSSSNFFQLLSSNGLVPWLQDHRTVDHEEAQDEQSTEQKKAKRTSVATGVRVDQIWTWLASGNTSPSVHSRNKPHHSWINFRQMKSWLSGELLGSLSKECRKKRKEELRLNVAQVHAALSVARLAAAIAGIVANCSLEPSNQKNISMSIGEDLDKRMGTVVASAAALVATVCAEAAESIGANRDHVSSVINSGLETRTSADIIALTATAATCLRGAATLELRTATTRYVSEDLKLLAKGTELLVRAPTGKVQVRIVWIYIKHEKLALKLGKKYMKGVLTTCKEYRIIDAMEDTEGGGLTRSSQHGLYPITVGTTGGSIQMLFEDDKLYIAWKSSLSHLLSDHH